MITVHARASPVPETIPCPEFGCGYALRYPIHRRGRKRSPI